MGGIIIYWFSVMDIADGCRARRLKIGSPLGRIVDESGDILCQAHYTLIACIAAGFDNVYAEIFCMLANLIFYSMELKHKVQGKLTMVVGELGPVETELIITIIVICLGYFGNSMLQKSVAETFDLAPDSTLAMVGDWRLLIFILSPFSLL